MDAIASAAPRTLVDLDFGDDALTVREHPDTIVSIDIAEGRLLLNQEQFRQLVEAIVEVGRHKLWIARP